MSDDHCWLQSVLRGGLTSYQHYEESLPGDTFLLLRLHQGSALFLLPARGSWDVPIAHGPLFQFSDSQRAGFFRGSPCPPGQRQGCIPPTGLNSGSLHDTWISVHGLCWLCWMPIAGRHTLPHYGSPGAPSPEAGAGLRCSQPILPARVEGLRRRL